MEVSLGLENHSPHQGFPERFSLREQLADSASGREGEGGGDECTSGMATLSEAAVPSAAPLHHSPPHTGPSRRHGPLTALQGESSRNSSLTALLLAFPGVPKMTQNCKSHIRFQQKLGRRSHDSVAESGTLWGPIPPLTHWSSSVLTALVLGEQWQLREPS